MSDEPPKLAVDFVRLFGDHTTALALLIHLAVTAKGFDEGPFRSGLETAIEEGGAWLDSQCDDGGDQMQTLMEQVVGLLNGSYALVERKSEAVLTPILEERG